MTSVVLFRPRPVGEPGSRPAVDSRAKLRTCKAGCVAVRDSRPEAAPVSQKNTRDGRTMKGSNAGLSEPAYRLALLLHDSRHGAQLSHALHVAPPEVDSLLCATGPTTEPSLAVASFAAVPYRYGSADLCGTSHHAGRALTRQFHACFARQRRGSATLRTREQVILFYESWVAPKSSLRLDQAPGLSRLIDSAVDRIA
jgi:hypothetical protein